MDDLISIIRREAHHIVSQYQRQTMLICTSYNPKTHAVKGILMPSGVESGWVPIATVQTAGGAGHFVGPTPGSADKLDGDQFEVHFENGNPNTQIAKPIMSKPDAPPMVQSGEVLTMDTKGNSTLYKQDGSVVFTHGAKQGTDTWDKDGNKTVDTKGQTLTVHSSGGAMNINSGGGTLNIN